MRLHLNPLDSDACLTRNWPTKAGVIDLPFAPCEDAPGPWTVEDEDGSPLVMLTPVPDATPVTAGVPLTLFLAFVDQHGHDDAGEVHETQKEAGTSALAGAVDSLVRTFGPWDLEVGAAKSALQGCHDIGRAYGLAPETIATLTGTPCEPRKRLIPPLSLARALDEQKRAAEANVREQAESAARMAAWHDETNTRTCDQLQRRIEWVAKDVAPPPDLENRNPHYRDASGTWFYFAVIPGLEVAPRPANVSGIWRTYSGSDVLPLPNRALPILGSLPANPVIAGDPRAPIPLDTIPAPTDAEYQILRARLREHRKGQPVPSPPPWTTPSTKVLEIANAEIGAATRWLLGNDWRVSFLIEKLVRGLCIRPDQATELVSQAAQAEWIRKHPEPVVSWSTTYVVPDLPQGALERIEVACIAAANSQDPAAIAWGALLPAPTPLAQRAKEVFGLIPWLKKITAGKSEVDSSTIVDELASSGLPIRAEDPNAHSLIKTAMGELGFTKGRPSSGGKRRPMFVRNP